MAESHAGVSNGCMYVATPDIHYPSVLCSLNCSFSNYKDMICKWYNKITLTCTLIQDMAVVEVTHQSFISRMCNSVFGVCCGLAIFLVSFPILFLNEGTAVANDKVSPQHIHRSPYILTSPVEQATNWARSNYVPVACAPINHANDNKLVSGFGCAVSGHQYFVDNFNTTAYGLSFSSTIEMYQWIETELRTQTTTKNTVGGGTTTTTVTDWTYSKGWSSSTIDSATFTSHQATTPCSAQNNGNPCVNPTPAVTLSGAGSPPVFARDVNAGDFRIPDFALPSVATEVGSVLLNASAPYIKADRNILYRPYTNPPGSPNSPQVGDIRVTYFVGTAAYASFVGQQAPSEFIYAFTANKDIVPFGPYFSDGNVTASQFFDRKAAQDHLLVYVVRIIGWIMAVGGLYMISGPLAVAPDIVPCIGPMIGMYIILTLAILDMLIITYYR